MESALAVSRSANPLPLEEGFQNWVLNNVQEIQCRPGTDIVIGVAISV
jgi:tartrate dehydratase alpha subunit/fumarate hydratase class I-like protein